MASENFNGNESIALNFLDDSDDNDCNSNEEDNCNSNGNGNGNNNNIGNHHTKSKRVMFKEARSLTNLTSTTDINGFDDDDSDSDEYADLDELDCSGKRAAFAEKTGENASMDLDDLLREMEEERSEKFTAKDSSDPTKTPSHHHHKPSTTATSSADEASLGTNSWTGGHDTADSKSCSDLNTSSKGSSKGNGNGGGAGFNSFNWGSFSFRSLTSSFRERRGLGSSRGLNSSRGFNSSRSSGRSGGNNSSGRLGSSRDGSIKLDNVPKKKKKKKKGVRFKKFETVFPSMESFSRLHHRRNNHHNNNNNNSSNSNNYLDRGDTIGG